MVMVRAAVTSAPSFVAVSPTSDLAPYVRVTKDLLRMPFDVMREQYASAVRAGVIERSLLGAARFERKVASLEQTVLGSWARRD